VRLQGGNQMIVQEDFTTQLFSIWKFFLHNLDKKSTDALSIVYAFIIHLNAALSQGQYDSKLSQAKQKLLFHFILCSFAAQLSI
jgi:hypothetical protein